MVRKRKTCCQRHAKALEWHRKAAAQGHEKAKEELAKADVPKTGNTAGQRNPNNHIVLQENKPSTSDVLPNIPDCKPLLALCTPSLYAENAFRITGLHVYATARDIRRRQEDLKTVEGSTDWQDEHKHALSLDEPPTPDQVITAFLKLQDPERRLIDELFWFWPLTVGGGKQDEAIHYLKTGNASQACQIWESTPRHRTHEGLAALHNLAVYHHLVAIEWEARSQQARSKKPKAKDLPQILEHWDKAVTYWETITDEDAFWQIFTDRIRAMDDPRLTTGFTRRLRATFPIAFDQINALLAAAYAEVGHFEHARRHVKYMEVTQADQDDVEKTIRTVFAPLEKRVNLLVEHAVADSRKTPQNGLTNARHLLQATKEPLSVAQGLLDEGHTIRTILFDSVAEACFSCLIAYGNKTEDWQPCSDLLTELETLAVSKEAKTRIRDNRDIARKNHAGKLLREQCWFCKTNKASESSKCEVAMHGEVKRIRELDGTRTVWRHLNVSIPRCETCNQQHATPRPTRQDNCGLGVVIGRNWRLPSWMCCGWRSWRSTRRGNWSIYWRRCWVEHDTQPTRVAGI